MEHYDSDKRFPTWGFGASLPPAYTTSHCFALNGNASDPEVAGVKGILEAYRCEPRPLCTQTHSPLLLETGVHFWLAVLSYSVLDSPTQCALPCRQHRRPLASHAGCCASWRTPSCALQSQASPQLGASVRAHTVRPRDSGGGSGGWVPGSERVLGGCAGTERACLAPCSRPAHGLGSGCTWSSLAVLLLQLPCSTPHDDHHARFSAWCRWRLSRRPIRSTTCSSS